MIRSIRDSFSNWANQKALGEFELIKERFEDREFESQIDERMRDLNDMLFIFFNPYTDSIALFDGDYDDFEKNFPKGCLSQMLLLMFVYDSDDYDDMVDRLVKSKDRIVDDLAEIIEDIVKMSA